MLQTDWITVTMSEEVKDKEDRGSGDNSSDHFVLPSPIPTKRERTLSQSERARSGPSFRGVIKEFCREKGHGFVIPNEGGDPLFVHISDVDGDIVPKAGDEVAYKKFLVPPKNEKYSAVHVKIIHQKDGVPHEHWEDPVARIVKESGSQ